MKKWRYVTFSLVLPAALSLAVFLSSCAGGGETLSGKPAEAPKAPQQDEGRGAGQEKESEAKAAGPKAAGSKADDSKPLEEAGKGEKSDSGPLLGKEPVPSEKSAAADKATATGKSAPGKEESPKEESSLLKGKTPERAETTRSERTVPHSASGLKAGFADDNRQFNYFLSFLKMYENVEHYPISVQERFLLRLTDAKGKSLPNATVSIYSDERESRLLEEGKTYADGTYPFFPSEYAESYPGFRVRFTYNQRQTETVIPRDGTRIHNVILDGTLDQRTLYQRPQFQNVPLDILFILDTTGSMGEEIERLKTTIDIINFNLASLSSKPRIRFGMVLYKDRGDEEYITRTVPLTPYLEQFREELYDVYASGGGDTPEDLQSALQEALTNIRWNSDGIRLGFIITDAPPHLSTYNSEFTYVDAAHAAKRQAIKLFSVGTGGLSLMGEYILRQLSQYTYAKYIFLTYGEKGESEGGAPGSVSHHTGANFTTDKLEAIIIRFAKEELSYLTDQPLEEGEEYFQAVKIPEEKREETLGKLFAGSLSQLSDYSTFRIEEGTPTAVLPIVPSEEPLKLNAEYFSDQLTKALTENLIFKGVERHDLQKILEELELGISDAADASNAPRIGKLMGAKLLITGKLYRKQSLYELFIKLVRVETGEILAASIARIDGNLGL